jgi:hypothetical protein
MQTQNNSQIVDQQYIENIRGAAKKRKAQELPQYKKDDIRSQHLEKQRLEIETYLKANQSESERVNDLNSTAWKVVRQRAKYFTYGGSAYQSTNKKGESKQISISKYNSLSDKQKAKYKIIARDGSGQIVEAQRLIEMHQAAVVALVVGHKTLNGKVLEPGIKAASSAAGLELSRSLQMPLFEDIEQAEKFHEKAWKTIRAELPDVAQVFDPERIGDDENRLRLLLTARREARIRLATYWKSSGSRQWKSSLVKDLMLLRSVVVNVCAGRAFAGEHDSSQRKSIRLMAERINKPLTANELQDIMESRRIESRKPLKTIKLWRSSGARWIEYIQSEPQALAKQDVVELPIGFRHLAHLRK